MHIDKMKEYLLLREIVLLTAENAEDTEVVRRQTEKSQLLSAFADSS